MKRIAAAAVVLGAFDMGEQWPADETRDVNGLTIYLWTIR